MNRALVIGCPGSGKSTFARRLRDKTGLPLFYLDQIYWRADRTTVDRETFDRQLKDILTRNRWIIDGNYLRTLPLRLLYCDTVFFLDYPVELCLKGIEARRGKAREDMPWIETTPDPVFESFVTSFEADVRPLVEQALSAVSGVAVHRFFSRKDAEKYLDY